MGQHQSRLIAFNHMSGDHSGPNISNNIYETLQQWDITGQSVHYEEEDLKLWRKTGPVGKLRNIVKFIRASPQRSERFRKAAQEVDAGSDFELFSQGSQESYLLLNNETRWNSTYLMIHRALQKRAEIETYIN
ncbi:hypothetical protein COL26b_013256 [Colletotrichum chrysophilum]|uniref:uncharacterized protein n=1 Tax=Colletotrichum chrysophilum TaxID=1836956 RepID=UPI002301D430|nr:uncharacterized protein COL26b_013256 [Colletotrichum chrysophilum]KAJ0362689.1 hypothetical protein COL26b_013256 [Colletotrichum chrysophilum]